MDVKMLAALSLSVDLPGAIVIQERCPACDTPLLLATDKNIAFCGYCTAKNERAVSDKTLLNLLKRIHEQPAPAPIPAKRLIPIETFIPHLSPTMTDLLEWAEANKKRLAKCSPEQAESLALSLGFKSRDVIVWMMRRAA